MAYKRIEKEGYVLLVNEGGKTLGYSPDSGIQILEVDGFAFKDLNGNGKLDPYEDWRLPDEVRAADLASRLSREEIAGLMLYSGHQAVVSCRDGLGSHFAGTYNGKSLEESGCAAYELSDQQKKFLKDDYLRHILITSVDDAATAARWNNRVQAFVEGLGHGIPANTSSDPRHTPSANAEFNAGSGGDISKWPDSLGLAATFDPSVTERFGEIASEEYRAMGIATALSPQVDMASEPRWMRFPGTFGESSKLSAEMARAYCDGFQTTPGSENGWGEKSVNAMVKHWPGGGSGEGGRDAHFCYGKFAVYPGNNFEEHQIPFTEGAFRLNGKTGKASAVMPYYTISWGQDIKNGENVGNSYSKYMITDLLRGKYSYDGVVCTDWNITHNNKVINAFISGKCWGVEELSEAERHYKALLAGVDQFGGNNRMEPVLEAWDMGNKEFGEKAMRERFEASARRLLMNILRTNLFENPYTDPEAAAKVVGCPEFMQEGYQAQLRSVVMLKNRAHVLPLQGRPKVYIPNRRIGASVDWFGHPTLAHEEAPVPASLAEKYFDLTDDPQQADLAICFMESPKSVGWHEGEGYVPVTLQYRPYTAVNARTPSIAGGDPLEESTDRSYRGKTNRADNEADLDVVLETRAAMGDKPVIVCLHCSNPTVPAEFEPACDAILVDFNVQTQALLDLIFGKAEPSARLPFQMPRDMETVEAQCEDVPFDMDCYTDSEGNTYDFGYGLNWQGIISEKEK